MACNSTAEYPAVNRTVEGSNPSAPAAPSSSGQGCGIFTPVARVRIPLGLLHNLIVISINNRETAVPKKQTDEEVLAALRLLEELGEEQNYVYRRLVEKLPASKRPPVSTISSAGITIVGTDDIYSVPDSTYNKLEAAVKQAWQPVTVVVNKKKYVVKFNCLEN